MKVELLTKKVSTGRLFKINSHMLVFRRESDKGVRMKSNTVKDRNGLYTSRFFDLPFRINVQYVKSHKSLQEELGIGNLTFDWLIDEFDSSFNSLAAASLKYHMEYAVTYCDNETRAKFTDLRDRLLCPDRGIEKPRPRHDHGRTVEEALFSTSRKECVECTEYYEDHIRYKAKVDAVSEQARKDFVEIMPRLWS